MRVNRGRSASAASASGLGCGASATSRGTMLCRNTAIRPGLTGWVRTKNGAPPRPIDPVIGGAPQAEPFAGHVPAWQIGETTVIDAHVAVGVEEPDALAMGAGHPLPGQAALPLGCLTVVAAEVGDFSPQGFDLR